MTDFVEFRSYLGDEEYVKKAGKLLQPHMGGERLEVTNQLNGTKPTAVDERFFANILHASTSMEFSTQSFLKLTTAALKTSTADSIR